MSSSISYDELRAKLRAAPDQTRHRLYFAALLKEAGAVPTDQFFVVGGSALEIYTVGEYTSGDIDIVSSQHERLREVMRSWNFKKEGAVLANEELKLVVDLTGYPYTGSIERTTVFITPYGSIRLAAIEDLLVKRLASAKHWKRPGDLDHAKLLAELFWTRMDWDYVEQFAGEQDVSDLLARLREAIARTRFRGQVRSTG